MRIGIIDVDSHNYPNIPLMKISAWHKAKGDYVEWYNPWNAWANPYDKVYMSKVFSFTKDYEHPVYAKEVQKGGSGYCIEVVDGIEVYHKERDQNLPDEIEHIYPDYSLYPEETKDTAYGFLSRGCPRGCDFCHVGCKEGNKSYKVADLNEFWKCQHNIVLSDPNILACKERVELLQQLRDSKARIDFNQGLDIRLLTPEIIELLNEINVKAIHFALDKYKDIKLFNEKASMFRMLYKGGAKVHVYILCNFDTTFEQDLERINTCRQYNFNPFPMIYNQKDCDNIYIKLKDWCRPQAFWSCENFYDFDRRKRRKR